MKLLQNGRGAELEPGELVWFSAVAELTDGFWRVSCVRVQPHPNGLRAWSPVGIVLAGERVHVPIFNGTAHALELFVGLELERPSRMMGQTVIALYPGSPP